jgi:hypothetical protein
MVLPLSPRNRSEAVGADASSRNSVHKAKGLVTKSDVYKPTERKKDVPDKVDPLLILKTNIYRYTKANDREMVIRSLESCKVLKDICLAAVDCSSLTVKDEASWMKVEDEMAKTKVCVNNVTLGGDRDEKKQEVFIVMEMLCDTLAETTNMSAEQLFQAIVLRLTPSIACSDIHAQLTSILGSNCHIVQRITTEKQHIIPKVDVYRSNKCVHLTSETNHCYGIWRKIDLATHDKKPWIRFVVTISERANLSTKQSVRYCSLKAMEPADNVL